MFLNNKLIKNIIEGDIDPQKTKIESDNLNILFVEGKSDRQMLEKIRENIQVNFNFKIIEMKGISNFNKLYEALWRCNLKIKYLTDNDYSARRRIFRNNINPNDVLTDQIYAHVEPTIKELEEYITNVAHYKDKTTKNKLINQIWEWKNISYKNINHLVFTLNEAFKKA